MDSPKQSSDQPGSQRPASNVFAKSKKYKEDNSKRPPIQGSTDEVQPAVGAQEDCEHGSCLFDCPDQGSATALPPPAAQLSAADEAAAVKCMDYLRQAPDFEKQKRLVRDPKSPVTPLVAETAIARIEREKMDAAGADAALGEQERFDGLPEQSQLPSDTMPAPPQSELPADEAMADAASGEQESFGSAKSQVPSDTMPAPPQSELLADEANLEPRLKVPSIVLQKASEHEVHATAAVGGDFGHQAPASSQLVIPSPHLALPQGTPRGINMFKQPGQSRETSPTPSGSRSRNPSISSNIELVNRMECSACGAMTVLGKFCLECGASQAPVDEASNEMQSKDPAAAGGFPPFLETIFSQKEVMVVSACGDYGDGGDANSLETPLLQKDVAVDEPATAGLLNHQGVVAWSCCACVCR